MFQLRTRSGIPSQSSGRSAQDPPRCSPTPPQIPPGGCRSPQSKASGWPNPRALRSSRHQRCSTRPRHSLVGRNPGSRGSGSSKRGYQRSAPVVPVCTHPLPKKVGSNQADTASGWSRPGKRHNIPDRQRGSPQMYPNQCCCCRSQQGKASGWTARFGLRSNPGWHRCKQRRCSIRSWGCEFPPSTASG